MASLRCAREDLESTAATFQRGIGNERRAFTPSAIRKLLINALAATGLTDANGDPLHFQPHDFRRIFVTDAIMNGLPPHIAQVICKYQDHRHDHGLQSRSTQPKRSRPTAAFIARRREQDRPSEEYRTPTDEEWDAFLAHFEKRKVSVGTCARAFGTPSVHEQALLTELSRSSPWFVDGLVC